MNQLWKAFAALCLVLLLCSPAQAQDRTFGQILNFYHASDMASYRQENGTVNGGNYAQAFASGPLQRPECPTSQRFDVNLRVYHDKINGTLLSGRRANPGCGTDSAYYGDAEMFLRLYYYNTATGAFDILVADQYTPLRLDNAFGASTRVNLEYRFPSTLGPGRYRALLWSRQYGVTNWQYVLIDFDANDDNLPRGNIDYHVDRCGNPLGPDCGISPRYVVAGWACDSPLYGGALDTAKLTVTKNSWLAADPNHPKYNVLVYSRPDVVAAGLCSNSAVGFYYEYNGRWWNPSAGEFDTYTFYYGGIQLSGKQVPDGFVWTYW
jgi:hypothetical protein